MVQSKHFLAFFLAAAAIADVAALPTPATVTTQEIKHPIEPAMPPPLPVGTFHQIREYAKKVDPPVTPQEKKAIILKWIDDTRAASPKKSGGQAQAHATQAHSEAHAPQAHSSSEPHAEPQGYYTQSEPHAPQAHNQGPHSPLDSPPRTA